MRMMRNKVKGNKVVALGGMGGVGDETYEDKGIQALPEMVDAEISNFRIS